MIQRIAQQVFERSDQLFQHRTIELDLRAAYLEIRAFVELLRRLTKNAVETLRQAAEGNRPDRGPLLLHVTRNALLRGLRKKAVETLRQAAEGNRPDREQLLLHFTRKPRLRQQRHVGLVEVLQQGLLNGRK